jgi:23S rRNA (cytosine1962-C5)-methyltransferase
VYRSDLEKYDGVRGGSVVRVLDTRGHFLGSALYSAGSQIALRLVSTAEVTDESLPDLVRERLRVAIEFRRRVVRDSDAFRVVFSEADQLPGVIVDRYADLLTFQVLTAAMDSEAVRAALLAELTAQFSPAGIFERVDTRIRRLEELPPREPSLVSGDKSATVFHLNGLKFAFDGVAGQKTGAFLDQRENYAAAAGYAHGRALDCFCYHGGFALHLARACHSVTAVDISREALETAERNEKLNAGALSVTEVEWLEGNAFDVLKDYSLAGHQYDTIVLDPPAFAKSMRNLETALRGYKEINLRALKMLRSGGILITCSCSFHVSEADFLSSIAAAAVDAHRTVRVLEKRSQSQDHPILVNVPETHYLKCLILQVV